MYQRELDRVFCGESWAYVGLEIEIPNPGDFKLATVGDRPLIMNRDKGGNGNVLVNRCAHRGVKVCNQPWGNAKSLVCPYHLWSYDLQGRLRGVPFAGGVGGRGGMPADFRREDHGMEKLRLSTRGGAVFATFSSTVEAFKDYLGPVMLPLYDRVFDGRELKLLGYARQLIPGNWKMMFENIKDPYHASLMHVFLVTFGLFRADSPSAVRTDEHGRHGALISMISEPTEEVGQMANYKANMNLRDPRLIDPVVEYPGRETVVMQTLWPNVILQQQTNTLAMRQLVPRGPQEFELSWTFFGYADDDDEMHLRRLRQANLMGPAGLVSVDDSEVMKLSQDGVAPHPNAAGVIELGGRDIEDADHMVTETAIRGFYRYYCRVMGF